MVLELAVVRSDSLAEHDWRAFPDRGCRYSPSCLNCPLPACIHDDPRLGVRIRTRELYEKIVAAHLGKSRREVAEALGVSERTVDRAALIIASTS